MYRHCIYCSSELGSNEALEGFPVGRSIAFDAAKGRLWAVCARCSRWNLAPLEERWEVVEAAEKRFRDTRLRAQRENVGMAKLPDGTRLIRIGAALPGELAAWRYGRQLLRRRRGYLLAAGAGTVAGAAGLAVFGGVLAAGLGLGLSLGALNLTAAGWWKGRTDRRVVHRLVAPDGTTVLLRRWHARAAVLRSAPDGGIELAIPDVRSGSSTLAPALWEEGSVAGSLVLDVFGNPVRRTARAPSPTVLADTAARAFLRRGMVHVNREGGAARDLERAVRRLVEAGGPAGFLARAGGAGRSLAPRQDMPGRHLLPTTALAVEMALHEEDERRALEGELALLESAWREAEEIAAIADRLALDARTPADRPGTV